MQYESMACCTFTLAMVLYNSSSLSPMSSMGYFSSDLIGSDCFRCAAERVGISAGIEKVIFPGSRIVFQPSFFRGEPLNFRGRVVDLLDMDVLRFPKSASGSLTTRKSPIISQLFLQAKAWNRREPLKDQVVFSNRKSLETDSISKGTSNLLIEFMRSQQLAEEGRTRQVEKQCLYEDYMLGHWKRKTCPDGTSDFWHVEVLNLIARHYVAAFLPDATWRQSRHQIFTTWLSTAVLCRRRRFTWPEAKFMKLQRKTQVIAAEVWLSYDVSTKSIIWISKFHEVDASDGVVVLGIFSKRASKNNFLRELPGGGLYFHDEWKSAARRRRTLECHYRSVALWCFGQVSCS